MEDHEQTTQPAQQKLTEAEKELLEKCAARGLIEFKKPPAPKVLSKEVI